MSTTGASRLGKLRSFSERTQLFARAPPAGIAKTLYTLKPLNVPESTDRRYRDGAKRLNRRSGASVHHLSDGRRAAFVGAASKIYRRDSVTAARETGQRGSRLRTRPGDRRQRDGA